ncbi:MAG: chromate transporter [Acidobacteriia bacterium]|nr:chromate transporter [Terriglobia bacterium]
MSPLISLFSLFAVLSLFAVGGAQAAIPEMHRVAVDVMHWLSDRQFADMYAISQVSPGPNVIIVALIGFHVAGPRCRHEPDRRGAERRQKVRLRVAIERVPHPPALQARREPAPAGERLS